jgi:hypothetical protein
MAVMTTATSFDRVAALALAFGVVLSVFAPGAIGIAAAAGNQPADGVGNLPLSIGVQQGAGSVVVSVSHNGTAVENASVNVSADTAYAGTGDYHTDADGIVRLPVPDANETVNATIVAEKDGLTGERTATTGARRPTCAEEPCVRRQSAGRPVDRPGRSPHHVRRRLRVNQNLFLRIGHAPAPRVTHVPSEPLVIFNTILIKLI